MLHPEFPHCQALHFLQMAAEKLSKAYLAAHGADPQALQSSHAYTAKQLPIIARQILARDTHRLPRDTWILAAIRKLARQIELLHPQVDEGGAAPANREYPWLNDRGEIIAPAEYTFTLTLLHERAGTTLIKIMRLAADELVRAG